MSFTHGIDPSFKGCTEARHGCHQTGQKGSQQHCLPSVCLGALGLSLISCGKHAALPPNSSVLQMCTCQQQRLSPGSLSSTGFTGMCREPHLTSFLVPKTSGSLDAGEGAGSLCGVSTGQETFLSLPPTSTTGRHGPAVLLQQVSLHAFPDTF